MTRTKDELELVVPQQFYTYQQARFGDGHVYGTSAGFSCLDPRSV
jgi:hypothetical protein